MPVVAKPYPTAAELGDEFIAWFWSHVQKSDGCWEWQRGRVGRGYGAVAYPGFARQLIASRVAYIIANGSIETHLHALHTCDNPPCCRPDHIYAGTHIENTRDWVERERLIHYHGTANCNAKLTREQVASARALHASGISGNVLAKRFGVSQPSMAKLLRCESYRDCLEVAKG